MTEKPTATVSRTALVRLSRALGNPTEVEADPGETVEDALIRMAAEKLAQPAASGEPAEWQAQVGKRGQWRRIDPPPGETMEQRVAYLRSMPAYEIRALYTAQPAPALAPLTDEQALEIAVTATPPGSMASRHQIVEAIRLAERHHGIFPSKENPL